MNAPDLNNPDETKPSKGFRMFTSDIPPRDLVFTERRLARDELGGILGEGHVRPARSLDGDL